MDSSHSVLPFPDLNFFPNPTTKTPKIEPKSEPLDELTAFHPQQLTPTPTGIDSSNPDLYSEFNRISELFRSAVPEGLPTTSDMSIRPNSDPNPGAIVPFQNPETHLSNDLLSPRGATGPPRKYQTRSAELVRVTDIKNEERRYFLELIRKTRMLYESLRVYATFEDEKQKFFGAGASNKRLRADLKAATVMRNHGLWLNTDKRLVGNLPGVSIGDVFLYRMEMCVLGLHGQPQAGIDYVPPGHSSNGEPIATSIIVSGGYEDDEDAGDVIVYTGHGGQDKHNKQVMHQKLECGNLGMERSMSYGVEVRVIRGFKYEGVPTGKVYVYDGLYRIIETWFDVGKSGFGVYKFKLVRIEGQAEMGSTIMKFAASLKARPLEVRPKGYVTLDLSRKKENLPVFFYNDIDANRDPVIFEYLVTTIFPLYVYNFVSNTGCECEGGCFGGCICFVKNGYGFPYDQNGILVRGKPLIFECGPNCHCPPTCRNRVTQKGTKNRFEVFRSWETGWGVRSLDLIQAGSFICEYAGVVLTREQAQIFTMNGDSLIYPSRFTERWREWGDVSKVIKDYVCPSYPSIPPLDFAMDVSKMRNVACYISHSSSPNVFVQLVLYDHNNVSFPHLMLFALENIPPMRELSIDYGIADESKGKLAICS